MAENFAKFLQYLDELKEHTRKLEKHMSTPLERSTYNSCKMAIARDSKKKDEIMYISEEDYIWMHKAVFAGMANCSPDDVTCELIHVGEGEDQNENIYFKYQVKIADLEILTYIAHHHRFDGPASIADRRFYDRYDGEGNNPILYAYLRGKQGAAMEEKFSAQLDYDSLELCEDRYNDANNGALRSWKYYLGAERQNSVQ